MKALPHGSTLARVLLGLVFSVFGSNFFLHFLQPPALEGRAGEFAAALFASGYVMQVVKLVEVTAGVLLLSNRFVPLALTLLAPVVVGILGFHLTLAPAAGGLAYVCGVLELYLAYAYRGAFKPLFVARDVPMAAAATRRPKSRTATA